ncbi:MAG: TonB family protein [Lysobacterales bacterium]|nr:MAG: TonB family protein [Xanthomonadales bacterium]
MRLIQGRFALALGFSTAAHVGLAWMVNAQAPSSAAPAQRALTVAMTPAAPRTVLNSIAPAQSALLSPAVVRPLAPPDARVIEESDVVVAAQSAELVETIEAPVVEAREAAYRLRALDSSVIPVAIAPSKIRVSNARQREGLKKPLPPSLQRVLAASKSPMYVPPAPAPGERGSGAQASAPQAVAGQPGANREALPASGNEPPEYPWTARARGHQGRVILRVWVSAEGQADRLAVLKSSGYPILDRAAVEAVERWRFQPARRGGLDTGSLLYVPVDFRLDDG